MEGILVFSGVFPRPTELLRYPWIYVLLFLKLHFLLCLRKMACGCKKKQKRGSGRAHFLSGVTWHKGSGMKMDGSGIYKKKRRRKKRGGMSMTGGGVNFSGSGFPFSGSGLAVNSALRLVANKVRNGRRVI